MAGRVAGKVALVTGAGGGIGRATARALAREGARVIATDNRAEAAEETVRLIAAEGGDARAMAQDTADEAQWEAVLGSIRETEGRLDVLVNNAGVGLGGLSLLETSLERWRALNAVNTEGVFLGTKLGMKMMAETAGPSGGSIVNISSIYGIVGAAGSGAYNASKGAVRLLTKSAALECCRDKLPVRVNSVHPGFIETDMTARLRGDPTLLARTVGRTPMGRAGQPEEIAAGIVFLASDESSFMTGAELVIDGGFTAV